MSEKKEVEAPEVGGSRPKLDRSKTGRAKGTPNKLTASVKEMLLTALEKAGGDAYLLEQSRENPTAFMSLIGKLLPRAVDLNAEVSGNFEFNSKTGYADAVAYLRAVGIEPDIDREPVA